MEHDIDVNLALEKEGYQVIRLWEKEIESDPDRASDIVFKAILKARNPYGDD